MKCVILAAGEGKRMRPLTLATPKPLLAVAGRPILEHIVGVIPGEITELIMVIGYRGDQIQDFCGTNFLGRKVRYVWQGEKLGTGLALKLCQSLVGNERFLLVYADDLYGAGGMAECLSHPRSLLVTEHPEPQRFGVVTLHPDGTVASIVEKPEQPSSNLVSTGAMVLDEHIFRYQPELHSNGEYYLTSMISRLVRDHRVAGVKTESWFPIGSPEDLDTAEEFIAASTRRDATENENAGGR